MSPEAPEMPLVALSAQDLLNSPPQKLAKGCWGILDIDMSKGHLRSLHLKMHNPKSKRCTRRFRIHWSIWSAKTPNTTLAQKVQMCPEAPEMP